MSLTSSSHSLNPSRSIHHQPLGSITPSKDISELPFNHLPIYITLTRTLTRLSTALLPLSAAKSDLDLTPPQKRLLLDLRSPLPYYRTKYLHTIEHARTLLLQLEQSAQGIKVQRVKRDVVRDLAEKRKVIRKLKAVVEELGWEAERREEKEKKKKKKQKKQKGEGVLEEPGYDDEEEDQAPGETVEELLGLPPLQEEEDGQEGRMKGSHDEPSPATAQPNANSLSSPSAPPTSKAAANDARDQLLNLRHRRPPNPTTTTTTTTHSPSSPTGATTSGFSSLATTEASLQSDRAHQDSLTGSLLSLAQQLKAQSTHLSTTLQSTDKTHLDRALAGLDQNVGALDSASKKMGLLKRMSEGEGWWGRIMLYLWIWGMWIGVVGLVFVGPKLRF